MKQYRELMSTVGATVLLTSAFPLGLRHCFILLCFKAPLVFVLTSGRKTTDYQKVLEKIIEILPREPRVKRALLDFKKLVWAIPKVLPTVKLSGCGFHWSQAVWRKIQYLGLQAAYHEHRPTQMFSRKVMFLPYVPSDDVEDMFNRLAQQADQNAALQNLFEYVRKTWEYPHQQLH